MDEVAEPEGEEGGIAESSNCEGKPCCLFEALKAACSDLRAFTEKVMNWKSGGTALPRVRKSMIAAMNSLMRMDAWSSNSLEKRSRRSQEAWKR